MKKIFLILSLFIFLASNAQAKCYCACINGENTAICEGPLNIEPICPIAICN